MNKLLIAGMLLSRVLLAEIIREEEVNGQRCNPPVSVKVVCEPGNHEITREFHQTKVTKRRDGKYEVSDYCGMSVHCNYKPPTDICPWDCPAPQIECGSQLYNAYSYASAIANSEEEATSLAKSYCASNMWKDSEVACTKLAPTFGVQCGGKIEVSDTPTAYNPQLETVTSSFTYH